MTSTTEKKRGPGRPRKHPKPETTEEVTKTAKPARRVPLGVARSKMSVPDSVKEFYDNKGLVLRWVNDTPGRIHQAMQGGYEFIDRDEFLKAGGVVGDENVGGGNTDLGDKVSLVAGKGENGTSFRAYLMGIKKEYYEEDQALKQKDVDKVDEALKSGSQYSNEVGNAAYKRDEHRINSER